MNPFKPEPTACPNCEEPVIFLRVGKFRSQCPNCNSLIRNSEIGQENQDPQ